jgi:hypothetical protein
MASLSDIVPSGVITGDDLLTLMEHARANSYAIPAVNCTRYVWCWNLEVRKFKENERVIYLVCCYYDIGALLICMTAA